MQKLITPYASPFGHVKGKARKPNVVINHFPDGESYVLIPKVKSLSGKKVTIYHSLYPDPDKRIFELLLILDRVKKETQDIELFVPYLPYARQDRENKKGEAVSSDTLCGLLECLGVKKLTTFDCHFLPGPGNFVRNKLKIENRSAGKELYKFAKKYFAKEKRDKKFILISPDEGGSYFTEYAQGHTGHALKKVRQESKTTGKKTEIEASIKKIEGEIDVKGKNVCILDDIIATGGTIVRALEHLKARGAKKIIVGATHGVFARENIANKIMDCSCDCLFISDSILKEDLPNFVSIVKLA